MKPSRRVEGAHADGIWSCVWKDNRIFTGSSDGTVKMWSDDLSLLATSSRHHMGILSVQPLQSKDLVLCSTQDGIIRFLNGANLEETGRIECGLLEAWTICSSHDDVVATGSQHGVAHIWSIDGRTKLASLETGNKMIMSLDFHPTQQLLATSGLDGMLNVFDVETSKLIHKVDSHALPVRKVKYSPNGGLIYTCSDDRRVNIFDTHSGTIVASFSQSGMALTLDTSPNHRHFAVGCSDHKVQYWDLGMRECMHTFDSQHTDQVWDISFNSTGGKFASVGDDALMQIYENSSV